MTTPLPGYRGNWAVEITRPTAADPRVTIAYSRDGKLCWSQRHRPYGSLITGELADDAGAALVHSELSPELPTVDLLPWVFRAVNQGDAVNPNAGGSASRDWNHPILEAARRDGWNSSLALWCETFLLDQLHRPEHLYNERGVPLPLLTIEEWNAIEKWRKIPQVVTTVGVPPHGYRAHDPEHGDWNEIGWMGRELDLPMADVLLLSRLLRSIRCQWEWRQKPEQYYGGAMRCVADIIEGCTVGLVRCAENPAAWGKYAKEIATCLQWHLKHAASIWPLLHPNSGGGHQPIKDVVKAAQQTDPDSWAAKGFGMSWQVARLMWAAERCERAMSVIERWPMANLAAHLWSNARKLLVACFDGNVLLDDFVLGDDGSPDFSRSVPYKGHTFGYDSSTQTWIFGATCGAVGLEDLHQYLRSRVPADYWNPEHERFPDLVDLLGLESAEVGP